MERLREVRDESPRATRQTANLPRNVVFMDDVT
jgi:hypothetical protein